MARNDSQAGEAEATASGVEELIERLRRDGVEAGRREAERVVEDAQTRANWLLRQAESEADEIRARAREEARRFRESSEEALRVAARDAVLNMKDQLARQFSDQVGRLVTGELGRPELLERLIIEIAGRARERASLDAEDKLELLLPESAMELAELREDPDELRGGELSRLVVRIAGSLLREGVSLSPGRDLGNGIRVRLLDKGIEIDLSDEAIARHLLAHLLPRFRALLEGMVY